MTTPLRTWIAGRPERSGLRPLQPAADAATVGLATTLGDALARLEADAGHVIVSIDRPPRHAVWTSGESGLPGVPGLPITKRNDPVGGGGQHGRPAGVGRRAGAAARRHARSLTRGPTEGGGAGVWLGCDAGAPDRLLRAGYLLIYSSRTAEDLAGATRPSGAPVRPGGDRVLPPGAGTQRRPPLGRAAVAAPAPHGSAQDGGVGATSPPSTPPRARSPSSRRAPARATGPRRARSSTPAWRNRGCLTERRQNGGRVGELTVVMGHRAPLRHLVLRSPQSARWAVASRSRHSACATPRPGWCST